MENQNPESVPPCKYCGSQSVVKFGTYKGTQLYWCKACKRKFKDDTNAFHMKVPADRVSRAVGEYYAGLSINDIRNLLKQETGYYPSKSVIFQWVDKYTDLAAKQFRDVHPDVGDSWVADETMLDVDGQHKVWLYDIIDSDTRFLLATRVALTRTTQDAEALMEAAKKRAGKSPKEVITDQNYSYLDGIERVFGSDTDHVQGGPFKLIMSGESTAMLERFHSTLKDRTKVMRSFRDIDTLKDFAGGWLTYYNFFRPHTSLDGQTPAEAAHVDYDVKNWADLTRVPVSKQEEIESHQMPKSKPVKRKVDMSRAYRRHRRRRSHQAQASSLGTMRG